ncbi:EAL domain-containing protein [Vagococcus sp. WN89Y]|uniref:EAL domain-containing protein n=1 Tax=Vagococcus sp. WN89Y TaxID=3457258 RepID=UPI003FCE6C6B
MTFIKKITCLKDKWWALPLLLPGALLPLISIANVFATVSGQDIILFYLSQALLSSLLMFFGMAALPGIILALAWHARHLSLAEQLVQNLQMLIPVLAGWCGYRIFVTRRYRVAYGALSLVIQRFYWQVLCPATLWLMMSELGAWLNREAGALALSIPMLITWQALLVGSLTGIPFCYLLIRIIHHPRYLLSWLSQMRREFEPRASKQELMMWIAIVVGIVMVLLMPQSNTSALFNTNYTLSLLLPIMLWGSLRYGFRFMSLILAPMLGFFVHDFSSRSGIPGNEIHLVVFSSSYLVFSFIVLSMAVVATRQRRVHERARRLAFIDPITHMPNLRALSRALTQTPWSVLCFLRVPELELLGRNYGVLLRIQYKQRMADWLKPLLAPHECIYQLSGHDLVIRLNTPMHQVRIDELDARIKQFRFVWNEMPLQPQVGLSYCYVRSPVKHLYLLLGEMSTIADLSLASNHPENLLNRGAENLQRSLKNKVEMMNQLHVALEKGHFTLMAQRISGVRGDAYYEILLRMKGEQGQEISPGEFLPVACEFGLSTRIDLWVVEHVLSFMARHRLQIPAQRFSINLSPASLCRTQFSQDVWRLLQKYSIEGWQLIFEITENHSLNHVQRVHQTLESLQRMGCRVAIDDFGTGYASYTRLKTVNADMLKIDGSFIRNIVSNSLDYQIVASICHLARMKKMLVVAGHVDSEEIRSAVKALGIDYFQGALIGQPAPLETLVEQAG